MSAKILTIFNQKGGCGKSMTTMQLAGTLGARGLRVFVADVDPQNTSALWYYQAKPDQPFPADVMPLAPLKESFIEKLGPISNKYDLIVVDCPPSLDSRVPWASLLVSDMALIPVIPVMDNVWASKAAEDLVFEARKARAAQGDGGHLEAAYLLSMYRRGKIYETCVDTLKSTARIPVLNSIISTRNAFPESQLYGCVAGAFGKSAAAQEVNALADELTKLLGLRVQKGR